MPMKHPPHPGDFIRDERSIEPAGLTVTDAAEAPQVSRPLSSLPNGKANLSGGMALRVAFQPGGILHLLCLVNSAVNGHIEVLIVSRSPARRKH